MNNKIGLRTLAAGVTAAAGLFAVTSLIAAAGLLMVQPAWAVCDSAVPAAGSNLKIARVIPEGDEIPPPGRQIVVTFDRPVVAIGQMALSAA